MLPVLMGGQMKLTLKGGVAVGVGRVGGWGNSCFGLLSMTYNLIWSQFGMHPLH